MAVACAQLSSVWQDTTDISSSPFTHSTGSGTPVSFTPTANRLLLCGIVNANNVSVSSLTGLSLTWAFINGVAPAAYRGELWWALTGASPGSGNMSFNTSAGNAGAALAIWQLSGTDLTAPIVQSLTTSSTATPVSLTLSAFGSATNGTFGMTMTNANLTQTAGSGFTEMTPLTGFATPTRRIGAEFQAAADTTVDYSLSASGLNFGLIGVEIKEAVAAVEIPYLVLARR